ncbi:MAG: MFS transporter [Alphaproteobacteria bacterium]
MADPAGAIAARLSLFFAATFAVIGLRTPYWPLWLEGRGLGPGEIGLVLAVGSWMQVAAAPWVASRVDRRGERRRVLVILATAATLGYASFALADGLVAILCIAAFTAACFTPVIPLGDNLAMIAVARHGVDYGRARLWGSITFIAASSIGGVAIAGVSERVLWLMIAAVAMVALAAAALPDLRTTRQRQPGKGMRLLLGDRRFATFLVAGACLQASHAMVYGFGTIHWQSAGNGPAIVGLLWAEAVLVEIVFFAYGRHALRRAGPAGLLALGGIAGILRWPALAASADPWVLVLTQPLHALTFGAAHLGAMSFIAAAVAPERSATAQSLYSAVASGIAFGIAMPLAGRLYGAFGGTAFLAMALLSAIGLAGAVMLSRGAPAPIARS